MKFYVKSKHSLQLNNTQMPMTKQFIKKQEKSILQSIKILFTLNLWMHFWGNQMIWHLTIRYKAIKIFMIQKSMVQFVWIFQLLHIGIMTLFYKCFHFEITYLLFRTLHYNSFNIPRLHTLIPDRFVFRDENYKITQSLLLRHIFKQDLLITSKDVSLNNLSHH